MNSKVLILLVVTTVCVHAQILGGIGGEAISAQDQLAAVGAEESELIAADRQLNRRQARIAANQQRKAVSNNFSQFFLR